MPPIYLVSVGEVEQAILEFLCLVLPGSFNRPCVALPDVVDPVPAYLPHRRQYHSTVILSELFQIDVEPSAKLLGVSSLDLCIPILTFVFGEAQVSGRAAVISVHRLRQEFYGLPEDTALFFQRCEKEAIHELGHAFGLLHCKSYECVMGSSNSVEQVDLKPAGFCRACAQVVLALKQDKL